MPFIDPPIVLETGPEPTACLIVLHGLGADGHDFVPVCQALPYDGPGELRFVLPHANPMPVSINGGYVMRAWYDIRSGDLVKREDEAGLRASLADVLALVEAQIAAGMPAERIVLMGFSQGCAMALLAGLRCPHRLGGIVGLSGYLPLAETTAAERHAANRATPVFLAHGNADGVVPVARGRTAREALAGLGQPLVWHDYAMDHEVCEEEIAELGAWLNRVAWAPAA